MNDHPQLINAAANIGDASFAVVGFGAYLGHLPDYAAALTILWYLCRFCVVVGKFLVFIKKLIDRDRSI